MMSRYFIIVLFWCSGSAWSFDAEPVLGRLMPVFHNLVVAHEEQQVAAADTPERRKAAKWYFTHVREHERYYAHLYTLNLLPEAASLIQGATPRDEFFQLLVQGSTDPAVFRDWLKAGDAGQTDSYSAAMQHSHLVLQGGMKLLRRYLELELVDNGQAVARFRPCDVQAVDAYWEPFIAWKAGKLPKSDEQLLAPHSLSFNCGHSALGKGQEPEAATRLAK